MSPASSSRRRSRASLVAALALAFLCFGGGARAEAASEERPGRRPHQLGAGSGAGQARPAGAENGLSSPSSEPDFRPRVVLALGVRRDKSGKPAWYRISLPGRPNGRTGWVPAASVDLKPIRKEIVIDRSERTLELRNAGRVVLRTRVAVGAYGMETPLGRFYIDGEVPPDGPDPRRVRLRDERLLQAERMARRRDRRDPRHEHAVPARAGRLARMRPGRERGDPPPARISSRSGRRSGSSTVALALS